MRTRAVSWASLSAVVAAGAVSALVNAAILRGRAANTARSAVPVRAVGVHGEPTTAAPVWRNAGPAVASTAPAPAATVPEVAAAAAAELVVAPAPVEPALVEPVAAPAAVDTVPESDLPEPPPATAAPDPAIIEGAAPPVDAEAPPDSSAVGVDAAVVVADQFEPASDAGPSAAYAAGAAGTAHVTVSGDRLMISETVTNPGWRLLNITPSGRNGSRAMFRGSDGSRVTFTASIVHDVVVYSVDTRPGPHAADGSPATARPTDHVNGNGNANGKGNGKGRAK